MRRKSRLVSNEIEQRLTQERFARSQNSKRKKLVRLKKEINRSHHEESRFVVPEQMLGIKKDDQYEDLLIPNVLDMTQSGDETLEFIRDLRRLVLKQKHSIRLIFNAQVIHHSSLLLLLAEIHRCRLVHGQSKLTGTYPDKGSDLEKQLHSMGFFELLGVKSQLKKAPKRFPVDYVKFISDTRPPRDLSKKFRKAIFGEEIELDLKIRRQMVRAIGEAMINVGQHAYPKNSHREHPSKGRWWLSGHVNKIDAQLTIMFCDLGVGIPVTLPKRYPMEIILSYLSILPGIRPNDGQMIRAGMEIGRSRTLKINRGKGLNDLRRIIDDAGEGELHIFSGRGCYRYSPGKVDEVENLKRTVGGTLIKWTIPLSKITKWVGGDENESTKNSQ